MKKNCNRCGVEFPNTADFFYRKSAAKDGLQGWCKACAVEYQKQYCLSNKATLAQKKLLYSQTAVGRSVKKRAMKKYMGTVSGHLCHVFNNMLNRCNNPKADGYHNYGGRGIKVCFKSFDEFRNYIINILRVDPRKLQIDRIDNDGNYESGNIRFVTQSVNQRNRRRNEV